MSVRPSIAAGSDGRVVVVWAKQTALQGMDVFSATSRDNAASFGQPVRVPADPGAGDQFDPSIAIAPDGRADIAFFASAPGGYVVDVSASNHPTGTLNAETWSQSVPVESVPIAPVPAFSGGSPTLGSRLGVDEVPRGAIGRAWTLIAWADTRNLGQGSQNEDVYSTVLLHQSTTPVGADAQAVNVPKNYTSPVNFTATDADADPLTYSIAQQGAIGTASIPDPNVPTFMYQAPKVEGPDQVQIRLDDGVHQSTMTVKLNIVNTPPTITCTSLTTEEDTPVSITASNCASDLNGDPVTLTASNPSHGKLQPSGSGVNFVPDTGFIGTGQVTLSATDGSAPPVTLTIPVHVVAPAAIDVKIVGDTSRSARTDQPIQFHAVAMSVTNQSIIWKFGDKTSDQGPYVSHLFQTAGTYDVTAQVGDNGPPQHIKVIVQKPPFSLKQTAVDGDGTVVIRVQLANPGTLTVGMVGVPGMHPMKQKMKRGTHTIQMKLPAVGAEPRGRPGQPDAQRRQRRVRPRQARHPALPRRDPLDRGAPGVEDRDAVRERELVGRRELRRREPRELGDVVRRLRLALPDVALVGEVESRVAPFAVHVGKAAEVAPDRADEPGLLEQLAGECRLGCLARLEEAAQDVPETGSGIPRTPAEQHPAVPIDDDTAGGRLGSEVRRLAAGATGLSDAVRRARVGRAAVRAEPVCPYECQSAPPAARGAVGSAASEAFSRDRYSSTCSALSAARSTTRSSVVMLATSSTCSLRNHCMNCSPMKSPSSRAADARAAIWADTRRS